MMNARRCPPRSLSLALSVALLVSAWGCGGAEKAPSDTLATPNHDAEADEEIPPPPPPPPGQEDPAAGQNVADKVEVPAPGAPTVAAEPKAVALPDGASPAVAEEADDEIPTKIIKSDSGAELVLKEGLTYLNGRNYFDARQRFLSAVQQDPQSATAWYNLAYVQWREGNFSDAIEGLNKAIGLNPTFSRAVVLLSVVELRRGDIPAARVAVKSALSRRPEDVMLLGALATVQVAERDFRSALETCVRALKLDYRNPELMRLMGEIYLGLNREGLAQLALNKAYGMYTAAAAESKTEVVAEGQVKKSQYDERAAAGSDGMTGIDAEAIDKQQGLAHIYYLYGKIALRKKKYQQARGHFLKSVEFRPDYPEAWNNLGITWIVAKKGKEAIAAFMKALELEPLFYEARVNLGNAYRVSQMPDRADQAKKQYDAASKLRPSAPEPYFNLGILFLENKSLMGDDVKRYDHAMELFNQYRQLVGAKGSHRDDPVLDYINEAKNMKKIAIDQRKAEEEMKREQAQEKARLEAEAAQKAIADAAAKKAADEEAAKKAAAAAAKAAAEAKAAEEAAPVEPPAEHKDGGDVPPPPAAGGAESAPPADASPSTPRTPPPAAGGAESAPPADASPSTPRAPPPPSDSSPSKPPSGDGDAAPAPPVSPAPAPEPVPPSADEEPSPPPPPSAGGDDEDDEAPAPPSDEAPPSPPPSDDEPPSSDEPPPPPPPVG